MYTVSNNLENLPLYLEHDSGYFHWELIPEELEEARNAKLVFCQRDLEADDPELLEGCFYVTVDTNYALNLSPAQQRLYEILLALQEAAIHTVTNVGKLTDAMGLEVPYATEKRLEHLDMLGAISGIRQ